MQRLRWGMALVVGLVAASLVSVPGGTPAAADASTTPGENRDGMTAAMRIPLRLDACSAIEIPFSPPLDKVRPYVPEVFTIHTTMDVLASAFLGGAVCQASSGSQAGTVGFVWTDIGVTPQDDRFLLPGQVTYLYRVEHLLGPGLYRDLNAQVGAVLTPMDAVTVTIAPLQGAHLEASGPGFLHRVTEATGLAVSPGGAGVFFREYGPAKGGFAYLEGTYAPGDMFGRAPAVLEPSPGSVAADMLGAPAWAQMASLGTTYTFGDAAVGLVPYP